MRMSSNFSSCKTNLVLQIRQRSVKLSLVTYSIGYLLSEIKEIKLIQHSLVKINALHVNANVDRHHFIRQSLKHCAVLQKRKVWTNSFFRRT